MIAVIFLPLEGHRQWRAVCVPIQQDKHLLCVGFCRYSTAASAWIARLRRRNGIDPVLVKAFRNRADTAKWILVCGGYAGSDLRRCRMPPHENHRRRRVHRPDYRASCVGGHGFPNSVRPPTMTQPPRPARLAGASLRLSDA
jgi:hypothetical protein